MRIKLESDLLKPEIRARVIEEIEGRENRARKYQAYKRYMCYKDHTNVFVTEFLLKQFDTDTVEEMRYALSNISIVRKIIDKLSRVYSNGVERVITNSETDTKKLADIVKKLDVNSAMKKANRFLKLEKNVDLFVKPCPEFSYDGSETKWSPKLECLVPYHYDVIENYYDRTKSLCVILSDYTPPATSLSFIDGKRLPLPNALTPEPNAKLPDQKDQIIADSAVDQKDSTSPTGEKNYVFWSKNYHFTTNSKGEIIPSENNPNNENPLKVFNHINFAVDQDNAFWAEGGDDLIDGAILINALITHTQHVGTVQGYGQFYMTGENLPRSIKVGPTKAILAEYKKDEQAEPKLGFLNANPQLDSQRGLIEMYIALLLTTNNLSTSGVATNLASGKDPASGIAIILDKAESLEDVQDQRQVFIDKEPDIFLAINAVLKTYGSDVVDELQDLELTEGFEKNFVIRFNDPTPIMTEKEKLENLKLRQDLGIDSMLSLLMKDDPSLDEQQAEAKLKKLIEQKLTEMQMQQKAQKEMGVEFEDPNAPQDPNGNSKDNNQDPNAEGDNQENDPQAKDKKVNEGNGNKNLK